MEKKFTSNQLPLAQLLNQAASGTLQLPDFQRGWVWDDSHIRSLLASVSLSYPIGAVMMLVAGNPDVKFKARLLEGVELDKKPKPDKLLLDGQQRLTSLFQALMTQDPVHTRSSRGKKLLRHYYAKIDACIDPAMDREEEGIVGVPGDRVVRSNFGRAIERDLRSREGEVASLMFPLEIVFDASEIMKWQMAFLSSGQDGMPERMDQWTKFQKAIIDPFCYYQVATIELAKSTQKEAVCQVFEKVNTGGVTLTVFELLTATYAADSFELRKDWEVRRDRFSGDALLRKVDATTFLQIVTLLATYSRRRALLSSSPEDEKAPAISCKRREVLRLSLDDYMQWADRAEKSLLKYTVPFLRRQGIFKYWDLPYTTHLVPLAAIFGWLEDRAVSFESYQRLGQWFWCGVLGEMYGGSTETRFALDLEDCVAWIEGAPDSFQPRTVQAAQFQAERLLTLRTRNSAAYKGLHALLIKRGARDFRTGQAIDFSAYMDHAFDIRYIFGRNWCIDQGLDKSVVSCIVNKVAMDAQTYRRIRGAAPSIYLSRIESGGRMPAALLDGILRSHAIDPSALQRDDFEHFFNQRFESLLRLIKAVMGKPVNRRPDRDESPFIAGDTEAGIRSLIESGESATVEFKSTAWFNLYSKNHDDNIKWAVVKTVAAFMNTHGGTLLIGVDDRGALVGIVEDFPFVKGNDRDGWERWLTTTVKNALGSVAATDLSLSYCTIEDRTIARIDVRPGTGPTFAKRKGKTQQIFYARLNNATQELSGPDLIKYQQQHWPNN
ncbi:MAG: DUF262 domain-containing protein [Bacteroidota bacterium]|nr:DUF262 domain-containing protein [Bacteroidota bacterium]